MEDDIQIVRFNHPPTNSITAGMLESLDAIVSEANENPGIKGIILTGNGRFFSSGLDLPLFTA